MIPFREVGLWNARPRPRPRVPFSFFSFFLFWGSFNDGTVGMEYGLRTHGAAHGSPSHGYSYNGSCQLPSHGTINNVELLCVKWQPPLNTQQPPLASPLATVATGRFGGQFPFPPSIRRPPPLRRPCGRRWREETLLQPPLSPPVLKVHHQWFWVPLDLSRWW